LFPLKAQKHCCQKRFLASKYPQNALTAGALPPDSTGGAHNTPSDLLAGLKERRERREGERTERKGREEPQTKSLPWLILCS